MAEAGRGGEPHLLHQVCIVCEREKGGKEESGMRGRVRNEGKGWGMRGWGGDEGKGGWGGDEGNEGQGWGMRERREVYDGCAVESVSCVRW